MTVTSLLGDNEELDFIINPTRIATSEHENGLKHNLNHFRSFTAKLPRFHKTEKNFTDEFFRSLQIKIPENAVKLKNIHVYGGPETGKSTLQRAIGYKIKEFYGDKCQCIECSFLPDAIHHIDHTKQVLVISVDDPMGAAEEGGTQDARRSSSEDVQQARNTFNAIRHIYAKRVLQGRAKKIYGDPLPDEVIKAIDMYHDNRKKLREILPDNMANVGGIIFVIWGPQLPTIDQTFHQNKVWNIYKGFSAMDEKRKATLKTALGSFWMHKLGEKERAWKKQEKIEEQSWSVIEDPYTNEKGWLYVEPMENIFKPVDRGGKGFQEKIKIDTEKLDRWAQHIYENRDILTPPYDPFDKKENRVRSIGNFLKDILKSDTDPRTFQDLAPHNQLFLKNVLRRKVGQLDDRIIKYHHLHMDERVQIEDIAKDLVRIMENEGISPHMSKGRSISHDIARSKIPQYKQFINKPGNFKRIFDHVLYLWFLYHPEDYKKGNKAKSKVPDKVSEELIEHATAEMPENAVEFRISEEEIIDYITENNPEYSDRALIYLYSEGIGDYDMLSFRQIYKASQEQSLRKKYGFPESYTSIEAIKYRKKQFRGIMSYVLGQLFEDWLEQILVEGYEIPNMIENVDTVQHSDYEDNGKPDFVLKHNDGSFTVLAAKCYASPRSETLEKDEIAPELRYHNSLRGKGKRSKIVVVYCNIEIEHLMVVYSYDNASDVPVNLTFPPSTAGKYFFRK